MSGFEVVSLISTVIDLIGMGQKLYTAIENTGDLPETFREVGRRLPLAEDTLKTLEENIRNSKLDVKIYTNVIRSCNEKAEGLLRILKEVAAQPDASRVDRYRLAVRRLGKESKVEHLMKGLLEDIQLLASNQSVKIVGDSSMNELVVAIEELSRAPPSAPDGPVITHWGVGDQITNSDSGIQNINKGSGHIYSAGTINVGYSRE